MELATRYKYKKIQKRTAGKFDYIFKYKARTNRNIFTIRKKQKKKTTYLIKKKCLKIRVLQ